MRLAEEKKKQQLKSLARAKGRAGPLVDDTGGTTANI